MRGVTRSLMVGATALLLLSATQAGAQQDDAAARALVERWFATKDGDARASVVRQLEGTKIGAEAAGKLAGLREGWAGITGGVYYVNEDDERGRPVRYFFGAPAGYTPDRDWPVVVMLPSATPFVTLPPPDADGVQKIYSDWIARELTKHPDAVVVMPLINLDELYGPGPAGVESVMGPLRHVTGKVRADPARVYLLGHSTGGHAAWNLAFHYPTYFAAVAPLAGAATSDWQRLRQVNLRNLLVAPWHDVDDPVVDVKSTRELVASLRRLKVDVDYEETRGMGHTPKESTADGRYTAMRRRVKDLYPKRVSIQTNRPERELSRVEWLEITDVLNPMSERRLLPRHGSGHLNVYTNPAKAEAVVVEGKNQIDVTTGNVAGLKVYLSGELVDLTKPVTVIVNRRVRFSGVVKPDVAKMLEDLQFLGRGWRVYPAVIEMDLTKPSSAATTTRATRP